MSPPDLDTQLRVDLRQAMRNGDRPATRAIRRLMGAISNAEAVPQQADAAAQAVNPGDPVISHYADVPRAEVSADDIAAILAAEIDSLGAAIAEYEEHGAGERAAELRHEKRALERYRR